MKVKTILWMLALAMLSAVSLQAQTPVAVYTSTTSQYYRIPAIVTASNGDLLLFNDDRHASNNDVGSNSSSNGVDLLVKRLNWDGSAYGSIGASLNITPNKSPSNKCYGDPAVVADRESDEVLVLAIGGTNAWTSNTTSYAIRSHNNGQTWDAPVQLNFGTTSFPQPTDNAVHGFFFASGRILQSKVIKVGSYYRIYVAFLYTTNGGTSDSNKFNQVYYSDDFGSTWNLLGGAAISFADEAKLEELPNGDVIITSRYAGGRRINKYTYSNRTTYTSGSWGTQGNYAFTGGCAINADMLTMTAYRTSDNQQVTLILLSTATGTTSSSSDGRYNTKIFHREIDNSTTVNNLVESNSWTPTTFTLPNTTTFGGYSAMTLQADNKIGVYYEGNTTSSSNSYSNLYYIAYTLEQLTGNAYTLTVPNPPVVVVPDVEVPDGVVPIYEWEGTYSPYWNDAQNWRVVNAVNNTPLSRAMVPPTPDENSNVKILAPEPGTYNPVLENQLVIKNLYVAPGAAIGNQHFLQIGEKVYTDVEIPTNQWVRVSMPLRDTYSGDMYTTTQGGVAPADEFTAATYNPTDGNSGNNRVFPYAIYQRVFSDAVNQMTDDGNGAEVEQLNTSWSSPYNDLAAKYQVAEGFDLWAPSTESTATFRFPSATNTYSYYYNDGTVSPRSETVNHAASGTMAYGNSGNGVMDVTLTRASRDNGTGEGVPMYAVGNPSFSYLDIAEFIRVNAYGASHTGDASVVGNITPYVYKYDEGENLNGGEASETIYFLDNSKNLYTVNATTVSNTTIPTEDTTPVAADDLEKYVAPTRGFRVMAGQAEVSAVEPKLIGNYSTSDFKIAPMRYGTTTALTGGTNTYSYISSLAPNSTGEYTTTLTISLGSSPDEIIMNGFCVSNVLVGKVNPVDQTITVKGGSVVGWQTDNANWTTPANTSSYTDGKRPTNRHIYAWNGMSRSTTSERIGPSNKYYYTQYASNLSADNDIVFDYTIASDGQIQITCRSGFAIYTIADNNATVNNVSSRDYPISYLMVEYDDKTVTGYNYPLTFNVYESFSATTTRTTTEESYICPEMFGTYKYKITSRDNGVNADVKSLNSEHSFNILPIEGAYDVVRITDFYAGTNTDYSHDGILGYITPSGSTYTLTIPSAQVVAYGSTGDFGQFRTFYKRLSGGRSSDPVVLTWNSSSKTFTIQGYLATLPGSIQISIYDGNTPNYLANGFSGTTTTQPVAVTVSQESDLISNDLLLLCHGSYDFYLSQSGKNDASANYISEEDALSQTSCRFVLVKTGDNYYLKSGSSNRYLQVQGSTLKWVNNGSPTPISISYETSGWVLMPSSSTNSYLRLTASGLSVSGSISYWSIFKVVNQSVFTTGTSAGEYIPQTTAWSGSTSGGSTTTGDFTVGTNYEAINLKFTAGMFNANPGYTPSASSAPRKTAVQGGTMASVTLADGNRTANTIIARRDNANNGYNAFEDAAVIDVDNTSSKMLATLAGKQVVAVNTLGDTTAVQLYINNVSGNFTLSFDNIDALGSNARLVDNLTGMETPLNGRHHDLTLNMTVNDSPLRYAIRWDVTTGTEEVELPVDGDAWFQALSTAKGTIKVVSNSEMTSVRLFDATGKLVASRLNPSAEAWFEYLLSGIYVVEASNGVETKSIKVNVK